MRRGILLGDPTAVLTPPRRSPMTAQKDGARTCALPDRHPRVVHDVRVAQHVARWLHAVGGGDFLAQVTHFFASKMGRRRKRVLRANRFSECVSIGSMPPGRTSFLPGIFLTRDPQRAGAAPVLGRPRAPDPHDHGNAGERHEPPGVRRPVVYAQDHIDPGAEVANHIAQAVATSQPEDPAPVKLVDMSIRFKVLAGQ